MQSHLHNVSAHQAIISLLQSWKCRSGMWPIFKEEFSCQQTAGASLVLLCAFFYFSAFIATAEGHTENSLLKTGGFFTLLQRHVNQVLWFCLILSFENYRYGVMGPVCSQLSMLDGFNVF